MPKRRELSYRVYSQRTPGSFKEFDDWGMACKTAVVGSMADQTAYVIDVFAPTLEAAKHFGGDGGARRFRELGDPDAVFERIEIRADSLGGGYKDGR